VCLPSRYGPNRTDPKPSTPWWRRVQPNTTPATTPPRPTSNSRPSIVPRCLQPSPSTWISGILCYSPILPLPPFVLFHGGGWRQGCRRLLQVAAEEFAASGYIVFSADYRLACQPSDNPTEDEAPLCGWQYPTIDLATGTEGAAVHDVLGALGWVHDH